MKFTCDRAQLVERLAVLSRGVSTRSALPVLSGVLVQAGDGRLDLYSTDMELAIKASLGVSVEREGELVVPARLLTDVVRNLPGDSVHVEAGESVVTVRGGSARFSLNAWSAGDFPQTSTFDFTQSFTIGCEPFVETLTKVGRAASHDETRPILTGVQVTIHDDKLKMVATDSYRLAVKETKLDHAVVGDVQAIIPAKALSEVSRLASTNAAGSLDVAIRENQALFRLSSELGEISVATRLIDGQFPNYRQLIPETFEREVVLPRDAFMAAARRVSLLAQKSAPLRLQFAARSLTMKALTQDVGQAEEVLEIAWEGEPFEIGFSPVYLIDGIDAVDAPTVAMRFTTPLRPGVIGGDGDFTYLIMPIRLSS